MSNLFYPMTRLLALLGTVCFVFVTASAQAEDIKVEARLIWATGAGGTNLNHKVAGPEIAQKLAAFKWKNFYEITNRVATVSENDTQSLEMSRKCLIKIKNMGGSRVEVSLFGDGKFLSKGEYSLASGKLFALAGPDRNDNAWFIVLRLKDKKDESSVPLQRLLGHDSDIAIAKIFN